MSYTFIRHYQESASVRLVVSIAATLREFFDGKGVEFDLVPHEPAPSSSRAAAAAHLPGDQVVKAVVLNDERGFLLVALPATHKVNLGLLQRCYRRHLGLASESDIAALFDDCMPGAVPPVGEPYGLDVLVDMSIARCDQIYFEAGDHHEFVHMRGADYRALLAGADHGYFSERC